MIKSALTAGVISAAISLVTIASPVAAPGQALNAVNVRTGPGTGYAKVGTLSAGERVEVQQCTNGWCYVDRRAGTDGWVSQNYLAISVASGNSGNSNANPPVNFGFSINTPDGGNISFGVGNPPPQPKPPKPAPPPPPAMPQVCFFAGPNFTDISFCENHPRTVNQLNMAFNNSISSIRVQGGAGVIVCQDQFLGGRCQDITSSRANLGSFNNVI